MSALRIATRASDLALAQSGTVADRVARALGVETELVPLKTSGDRLAGSLSKLGGKGLFVKEIEEALRDGRADLAVHSAKDLPAELAPGLTLALIPESADPRDALVARRRGVTLDALPQGARVGTGSLRRQALLRARRPDLEVVPLRGNVPTRLRKLEDDALDAVVLACAGLGRLGLEDRIDERIAPESMLPAVGQGVLAIEAREDDPRLGALTALGHPATAARLAAERAFLAGLGGDCSTPLAALAEIDGGRLRLRALLASGDGGRIARAAVEGATADAAAIGAAAADTVLRGGGAEILAELRAEAAS